MSMRQYELVETMLKSLPRQIARSASFRERYKAFMLAKWVAHGWKTEDPHLVLATLLDNVPSSEADAFIQQAAAQARSLTCLFFCPPSHGFSRADSQKQDQKGHEHGRSQQDHRLDVSGGKL